MDRSTGTIDGYYDPIVNRSRNTYASLGAATLLFALLAALAVLQYRWTERIGDAERQQLQANLQTDLQRFARDFNAEISRLWLFHAAEPDQVDADFERELIRRHIAWREQALHPGLVESLIRVVSMNDGFEILVLSQDANAFVDVGAERTRELADRLSVVLEALRVHGSGEDVPNALAGHGHHPQERRRSFPMTLPDLPAVAIPQVGRPAEDGDTGPPRLHGVTIVGIDRGYLVDTLFPAWLEDDDLTRDYEVTIVSDDLEIYPGETGATGESSGEPDAAAEIFAFLPGRRFRSLAEDLQQSLHSLAGGDSAASSPERVSGRPWAIAAMGMLRDRETGAWRIEAVHRAGSLEAAVAGTRRINLAISSGILILLGAAVALILRSARRSQQLANDQMEFVARVSHELRTPLAVVCSAGQNLADGLAEDPERIRHYGELILREGRRLTEMVRQVLDFAGTRSRRKPLASEPVAIAALIEAAVSDAAPLIEERGFSVELDVADGLSDVPGDATALRQAVHNLVANAVRYSSRDRLVTVRVRNDDRGVCITVEDSGPGIPADELERVFEPFFRGSNSNRQPGSGLGLSLVQEIAVAHGGKVDVESSAESGSRFNLHVPS